MKIAFINPDLKQVNSNKPMKKLFQKSPNMYFYNYFWSGFSNGLLTLAALTPDGADMKYIEERNEPIDFTEKFDLVAITATTQQATRAYQIAKKYKECFGDKTLVVIGGSHVTFMPDEANKYCDVVFRGEAERTWPVFLNDYTNRSWKTVYDSKDYPPVDMNSVPTPRYDLLNPKYYKMVWIQSSRGCPRNCEFCSATRFFGGKYRTKNLDRVVDDIEIARKYLKFQQILFADDNMFINSEKSNNFIQAIKRLNISYVAQTDISIGKDPEFLKILKESGCSVLFIGFESLEEKNLELINNNKWKLHQLQNYASYIKNIQSAGIGVYGAFVVGYDWDTKASFKNLAQFITDNYLAGVQITILTPLPGTALRSRYEETGKILDTDWENYTFNDVNIKHSNFSKKQLEKNFLWVYKRIYNKQYLKKKNKHFKNIYSQI